LGHSGQIQMRLDNSIRIDHWLV